MSALPPQYEFNDEQSRIIESLAGSMNLVGGGVAAVGAMVGGMGVWLAISGIFRLGISAVAVGTAMFVSGLWVSAAARRFRRVAVTRGRDISHLMDAIVTLRQVFVVQMVLLVGAMWALFIIPMASMVIDR